MLLRVWLAESRGQAIDTGFCALRLGQNQLDCVGSIQEKITICASEDSYQLTRERVSQVEKEAWSRAAIEIKPAAQGHGKAGTCQGQGVAQEWG